MVQQKAGLHLLDPRIHRVQGGLPGNSRCCRLPDVERCLRLVAVRRLGSAFRISICLAHDRGQVRLGEACSRRRTVERVVFGGLRFLGGLWELEMTAVLVAAALALQLLCLIRVTDLRWHDCIERLLLLLCIVGIHHTITGIVLLLGLGLCDERRFGRSLLALAWYGRLVLFGVEGVFVLVGHADAALQLAHD